MAYIGEAGVYVPHPAYEHLRGFEVLAAIVGRVHPDGTIDAQVFVPGREPHWQERLPVVAFGPETHCFRPGVGVFGLMRAEPTLNDALNPQATGALVQQRRPPDPSEQRDRASPPDDPRPEAAAAVSTGDTAASEPEAVRD